MAKTVTPEGPSFAEDDPLTGKSPEPVEVRPPPEPTVAGRVGVLEQLKRHLGLLLPEQHTEVTRVGPDLFPLPEGSPLAGFHAQLTAFFHEVVGTPDYVAPELRRYKTGRTLLKGDPATRGEIALAAAERHMNALLGRVHDTGEHEVWKTRYTASNIMSTLLENSIELDRDGLFDVLLYYAARPAQYLAGNDDMIPRWIERIEKDRIQRDLSEGERYVLWLLRRALISVPLLGVPTDSVRRLTRMLEDGADFCLAPGEAWADAVNDDFTRLDPPEKRKWLALWTHALTATTARPSAKWLRVADKLIADIGASDLRDALERWLPQVTRRSVVPRIGTYAGDARGATEIMHDDNATCLRGLLWLVPRLPDNAAVARHLTSVALSAYKKVPGVGPRAVKVGNAAVYALSAIGSSEAVGQLAMLKVRVKFASAQKEIEKAFHAAAEALGLPRDQIEEMGIPTYDLGKGGRKRETVGEYEAEILVTGADAHLRWFDPRGKELKAVPAKVKREHPEVWKELVQNLKDIQGMLPAQRDRIDALFLAEKSWAMDVWQQRYLQHPLVGTIASRLIWLIDETPAFFLKGKPTDADGHEIAHGKTADISLWHPAGRSIDEVTAWRRRLDELAITQPFKQAHREVYLLTDAERRTHTYSNRFAAHIIRQHQFHALCAARGWKNRLRLMVDDEYPPPSKELPAWGLRAEFWVEPTGDQFGTDTNASGVYLRLATDQVRFYRVEAAANRVHASGGGYRRHAGGPGVGNVNDPIPLEDVPQLVFSEIMRDIDLFVGVSSVGNDPTWYDGGPEGRYREYWQSYSFGELSGSATTRKQVLEGLIPRLKIAERCTFADRFLVVRGERRTYKIHLGSGNILMEPNDQYLCIVPDSRVRAKQEELFLPFEGDNTLSIIISKAFLLADDHKIKDPTIVRQIEGY